MIVIDLSCTHGHRFEGWFASAVALDAQLERGLVSCPVCATVEVRRLPSAPYVQTRASAAPRAPVPAPAPTPAGHPVPALDPDQAALLLASLRQIARAAEDVGDRFAEEARRIHEGDSEARSIRGAASSTEVSELLEDGIMVLPVPADEDLH